MIIETGIESHPSVEVTGIYLDVKNGRLDFHWGEVAPYSGDCSVPFTVNEEGTYTAMDIRSAIVAGCFSQE